jgi:predicted nucleic acid-binding protein
LVWSAILDYECGLNPFSEQRMAILHWRDIACVVIKVDEAILEQARHLLAHGVTEYDALHAACSTAGQADIFVTTDDRLLKRLRAAGKTMAMLPQDALAFLENWYEN